MRRDGGERGADEGASAFRRTELGRELDEEIAFHIAMRARELEARGWPADAARREAVRRFGDVAGTRAVCVEADLRTERRMERGERMAEIVRDVRAGVRQLWRRPGFALVAVATLAIGIGANTAIFSAADHVLLRPLGYDEPHRVVTLWETDRSTGDTKREVAPGNYLAWRERAEGFEALGLAEPFGFDFTGGGPPEPVEVWLVSEGWFEALGVRPLLGRAFAAEDYAGGGHVVVLSHGLWRDRFGSDPAIVGATIELDNAAFTVLGVLPELEYPRGRGVWAPKRFQPHELEQRVSGYMLAVGRLAAGVTAADAQREMDRVASALAAEFPATNSAAGVRVVPLAEHVLGGVRPALLVLLGAVGLVLLIACANVASLLLARGAEREREIAVRAALGAGRWRLARQLVIESVVLALAGGVAGLALAAAGVRALAAVSPPDLPRIASIAIDGRVLAFAFGITLLTALLFGLVPALQQSRVDLRGALGSGTRSVGGGALGRLRSVLVASEIGLALVLLIGAGLLGRSFLRLLANDLGFAVENRAAVQLFLWDRAPTAEQRIVRARAYEATLRATPGVEAVGIVSALPFHPSQIDTESELVIAGRPETEARPGRIQTTVASPDYFAVMQIPLRAGRAFTAADRAGAPAVAIVNETLARRYFAGADPLGQVVTVGVMGRPIAREIVGVVGDVRPTALDADPRAELFVPFEQSGTGSVTFVVRTAGAAAALLPRLRERVWSVDPAQAIYHSATVERLIADTLRERRFHLVLIGSLSAVALVLSIVGIYGLIRFATQRRQAEIGVRMALGARRGDVTWMIVREALRFAVPGVALGVVASLVLTRFLRSMLYGVTPADPATFAQLAALMLAIAAAAASLPAWRAASTDPMRVLRRE